MPETNKQIQGEFKFVNPEKWVWKRWDVRADGKVFWQYSNGSERWVTWESALRNRKNLAKSMMRATLKEPEKYKAKSKKWREQNRKHHAQKTREWYRLNRKRANETKRKRRAIRRAEDPLFALKCRIRTRTTLAFKSGGYTKKSSLSEIMGADWITVKKHIEKQFRNGMSWENRDLWHIDHITPLASAKNECELIALCHYTNLQPLWAMDNLKKGQSPIANFF